MTSLLHFLSMNNGLFLLFWNTISRAGLWRYLSNIKGTIKDQACSAATSTTSAGLLITFDSLPWQQRVNHAPAAWQVNHKPTVWPNTKIKFSLDKRVNIFINAEVQWPLPFKTIMHSTSVSNQVYGRIQFLSYRSSGWSRNWESTEQVLASAGEHLGVLVNSTLQQCALVSRPREKASSTLCLWSPL